jgi:hypothetical protein
MIFGNITSLADLKRDTGMNPINKKIEIWLKKEIGIKE